jgi:uncharacterized repeat protein (TIGR03837 family)
MWDLFCEVIDNYGDIGVSWRLARVLQAEQGARMRLWVDDLDALARIEPRADARRPTQHIDGIEVRRWVQPFPDVEPADAVIEAFGCRLPERYVEAMAARERPPAWVNLEYLTAEPWAAGCHGLPSPHPRLPLVKHFFFPGFDARTGGILRERGLLIARDAHQRSRPPGPLRVSVFGYGNAAWPELLEAWAAAPARVECRVPEGRLLDGVRHFFGRAVAPGARLDRGMLELHVAPFTDQAGYDRLLWDCDLNFVRGEDSFVRAQWAARPLVWQIYPQDADAHHVKLDAFMQRYVVGMPPGAAAAWGHLMRSWNQAPGGSPIGDAWTAAVAHLATLQAHAARWAEQLAQGPELAAALAEFIRARVK